MPGPDYSIEKRYAGPVAGIDEAGRGPLAGPVVAAAVVLDPNRIPSGIDDSKRLSAAARTRLFTQIEKAARTAVGIATVEEIDRLNILGATKLAMQRAYAALQLAAEVALIDGNQPPELPCPVIPLVKGDSRSLSIAAASIIAKVTRDRMMHALAEEFPHYGWEKNAGYGTRTHLEGLARHGVCREHRKSFAPVRAALLGPEHEAA